MFSFRFCKQLTPQPATVSHLLMLVDFSKESLVTMDQENESDRKHRLKTDGLGNQDEEVFAIHSSLSRRFHRRQKSGNVSTCTRLWSNEVLVKRSWLLELPFSSFSTMCFMQTKIPHAFVNAELRRKNNRNIIPTNDIRRDS